MTRPEDDEIPLSYDESMDRNAFEEYAAERLDEALWAKLEDVLWDDTFDLQPEEYARLEEFTGYGQYTTAAIGLITFGFLRVGRLVLARNRGAISNLLRRRSSSTPPPSSGSSSPFQQPGSPPIPLTTATNPSSPPKSPSMGWTIFHICFDLTLSYVASFIAPIVLVDELTVAEACVDMPLLPGPSVVADTFCPVTQRELKILQAQAVTEEHQQALREPSPSSLYLQALIQFARNCDIRQRNNSTGEGDDDWVENLTSDNERFDN